MDSPNDLLWQAIRNNDNRKLVAALTAGADPNAMSGGDTPLCYVIKEQQAECVAALLNSPNTNLNQYNQAGKFPLQMAAYYANYEIGKMLLDHGADKRRTYQGELLGDIAKKAEKEKRDFQGTAKRKKLSSLLPKRFFGPRSASSQAELLLLSKQLGYKKNKRGVCHAISMTAMQAILIDDFASYERRLNRIYSVGIEALVEHIHAAQAKRLAYFNIGKAKYAEYCKDKSEEDIDIELLCHSVNFKAQEFAYSSLTETEKIDVDIPAFFDSIEVHQIDYKHRHLKQLSARLQPGDLSFESRHLKNIDLVGQKGIENNVVVANQTIGIYNRSELLAYFHSLRSAIESSHYIRNKKKSISIKLDNSNHSILVSYDCARKEWMLVDANRLHVDGIVRYPAGTGESDLVNDVSGSLFSKNSEDNTIFAASFYCKREDQPKLSRCLARWMRSDVYRNLHAINPDRAKMRSKGDHGNSYYKMVNKHDHKNKVSELEAIGFEAGSFLQRHKTLITGSTGAAAVAGVTLVALFFLPLGAIPLGVFVPIYIASTGMVLISGPGIGLLKDMSKQIKRNRLHASDLSKLKQSSSHEVILCELDPGALNIVMTSLEPSAANEFNKCIDVAALTSQSGFFQIKGKETSLPRILAPFDLQAPAPLVRRQKW